MTKILVIEDEKLVRESLLDMLAAEDIEVVGAENGLIGVGLATKEMPDLILCDIMMPQVDGYSVLNALQQQPKTAGIPFVFLSAKATMSDIREGMKLGADDYLTKPFTRADLLRVIDVRLGKKAVASNQFQDKIDQLRSQLSGSLPHALSSPLSTITMSAYLLKASDPDRAKLNELAETIHEAAEKLSRRIRKFLLFADLELAGTDANRIKAFQSGRTTTPKQVVTEVSQRVALQYGRTADLNLALVDAPIKIGSENLEILMEEILDNAFAYSQRGSTVRLLSLCNKNMYVIYVTDNGRGMSPQYIFQLNNAKSVERKILEQQPKGLGLRIAERVTEYHGGNLGIESIPGLKTIIRVSLPLE